MFFKRNMRFIVSSLLIVFMVCCLWGCSSKSGEKNETTSALSANRTIVDIAERSVVIPQEVNRVVCLHPIPTYMVWRLAPEKLVSIDMVFKNNSLNKLGFCPFSERNYQQLTNLPVTGVYFKGLNIEQLLELKPDVVITLTKDPNIDQLQQQLGIPVVAISKDTLNDYEESLRIMGKVLNSQNEANKLADYWHNSMEEMVQKPAYMASEEKVKTYYASHEGGLSTIGSSTVMASIIKLAGGLNVAEGIPGNPTDEHLTVSLEQILKWNPDVIITKYEEDKQQIMKGNEWQTINAVKNGKVYTQLRYASVDGMTALIGLMWMHGKLYNEGDKEFNELFESKIREFYNLFYHYQITPEQIMEVQHR